MKTPDDATLRRFLLGQLPLEDAAALKAYIDTNPDAVERLRRIDASAGLPRTAATAEVDDVVEPKGSPVVDAAAERTRTVGDAGVDSSPGAAVTRTSEDLRGFLAPAGTPGELGQLGDYRIIRVLGEGGMGIVFEAEDIKLGRRVAVKAMRPSVAQSPTAKARFLREAKAAAAVEHDHVIHIHLIGEERGVPFLVMPYLRGETLDDRVKRVGTLPVAEIARIGREVALGLAAAHERGLIHRDIKPANLWLEEPGARVKILDFGLARGVNAGERPASDITQSGAVVGTPAYMSPEQGRGQPLDARSDLFSLGGVLYRLATGRQPFPGDDPASVLMSLAADTPVEPRTLNADIPAPLSAYIMRLLQKDPARRPTSAQEVARQLASAAAAPVVTPAQTAQRGWRPLWLTLGTMAAVLLAVGMLFSGTMYRLLTNKGVLLVEIDDPQVEVSVLPKSASPDDAEHWTTARRFLLPAGEYELRFRDPESGVRAIMSSPYQIERNVRISVQATRAEIVATKEKSSVRLADSPADEKAPKDFFPGTPVAYETFDEAASSKLFTGTFDGARYEINRGRYIVTRIAKSNPAEAKLGPPLRDLAFATRLRADSTIDVEFRRAQRGPVTAAIRLRIDPSGSWELREGEHELQPTTAQTASIHIARSQAPDPNLAAGRWISIAGRVVGEDLELWLNGHIVARGKAGRRASFTPAANAVAVEAIPFDGKSARLEIDHFAIWDLTAPTPDVPPGDKPPPKDLFPGALLINETCDDPQRCGLLTLKTADRHLRCENGVFTLELFKAKTDDTEGLSVAGPVRDVAIATRLRGRNVHTNIAFRRRQSDTRVTYLLLQIEPDGSWVLCRVNWARQGVDLKFIDQKVLAGNPKADADLASGQWINIKIQSVGPVTEIWLGPRVYSKATEPDTPNDSLPLAPSGVDLGPSVVSDGPARLDIDYVAVWKLATAVKLTPEEQELLMRINKERAAAKLAPLAANALLFEAARKHAYQMAAWGKLTHDSEDKSPPERAREAGYQFQALSENVALVPGKAVDAISAWLGGPEHKANLLGQFVDVGLGIGRDAKGEIFVAAMFAVPKEPKK